MATYAYLNARQKYDRPQAMLWSKNAGREDVDNNNKVVPYGYEIGAAIGGGSGITPTGQDKANDFIILSDHNRGAIDIKVQRLEQRERMINGRMRSFHVADKRQISVSWDILPSRSYADYPSFRSTISANVTSAIGNGQTITYVATGTNIGIIPGEYVSISNLSIDAYNQTNAKVLSSVAGDNSITFTIAGTATGTPTYTNAKVSVTGAKPNFDPQDSYTADGGAGGVDIFNWYQTNTGSFYVFLAYDNFANFDGTDYDRLNEYNEVIEMFISDFSYDIVRRGANNYDFWNISVTLEEV